jgi:hypothetical protein
MCPLQFASISASSQTPQGFGVAGLLEFRCYPQLLNNQGHLSLGSFELQGKVCRQRVEPNKILPPTLSHQPCHIVIFATTERRHEGNKRRQPLVVQRASFVNCTHHNQNQKS